MIELLTALALTASGTQDCNANNRLTHNEDGTQKAHCWVMDMSINSAELAYEGWTLVSASPLISIEPYQGQPQLIEQSYWSKDGQTVQCRTTYYRREIPGWDQPDNMLSTLKSVCFSPYSPEDSAAARERTQDRLDQEEAGR